MKVITEGWKETFGWPRKRGEAWRKCPLLPPCLRGSTLEGRKDGRKGGREEGRDECYNGRKEGVHVITEGRKE